MLFKYYLFEQINDKNNYINFNEKKNKYQVTQIFLDDLLKQSRIKNQSNNNYEIYLTHYKDVDEFNISISFDEIETDLGINPRKLIYRFRLKKTTNTNLIFKLLYSKYEITTNINPYDVIEKLTNFTLENFSVQKNKEVKKIKKYIEELKNLSKKYLSWSIDQSTYRLEYSKLLHKYRPSENGKVNPWKHDLIFIEEDGHVFKKINNKFISYSTYCIYRIESLYNTKIDNNQPVSIIINYNKWKDNIIQEASNIFFSIDELARLISLIQKYHIKNSNITYDLLNIFKKYKKDNLIQSLQKGLSKKYIIPLPLASYFKKNFDINVYQFINKS